MIQGLEQCCVVCYGVGDWHPCGVRRLQKSLTDTGYLGGQLMLDRHPGSWPRHEHVPYAFKVHAIYDAINAGFKTVLWCDASVWAIRSLDPLFQLIQAQGHAFFLNGWNVGQWCSDAALGPLGIEREQSFTIQNLVGGCMGFDLESEKTRLFLARWMDLATKRTAFKGAWTNDRHEVSTDDRVLGHRHDQTVASVLAWELGMTLTPPPTYFAYWSENPTPDVCLVAKGGCKDE